MAESITRSIENTEELSNIDSIVISIREGLRQRVLSGEFARCPELADHENHCEQGAHAVAEDCGMGQWPEIHRTRPCPIVVHREASRRRREILSNAPLVARLATRYGLDGWDVAYPLWRQLLAAMDPQRPVRWRLEEKKGRPLSELLALVRRGCEQPDKDAPHLLFSGPCGTGKTTLQAILYLATVEAGIDAIFLDSIDIRKLVTDLNSRYTETAVRAENEIERLVRREVIFWSDAGDTCSTRKEFAETLSTILERFGGRLVLSTNLTPLGLEQHPDIGQRAMSRLTAARNRGPALIVLLDGDDQRRGAAPKIGREILAL